MTREEAKELFEDNFTVINTHGHYTKEEEGQAQELAISALSENRGELTNEKAIAFLQDNGWLVEHDRIMTSGINNKGEDRPKGRWMESEDKHGRC